LDRIEGNKLGMRPINTFVRKRRPRADPIPSGKNRRVCLGRTYGVQLSIPGIRSDRHLLSMAGRVPVWL